MRGDKTILAGRTGIPFKQVSEFFSGRKPLNERYLGLLHAAEQLIADRRTALNNGPLGPLPTAELEVKP
ncbi:MAG: hypothetical protein SFY70_06875 [Bacteroidia bacterium]|nr:hypothetical protein [Bacteroidia bacterium]